MSRVTLGDIHLRPAQQLFTRDRAHLAPTHKPPLHKLHHEPPYREAAAQLRSAIEALPEAERVIRDLTAYAPASPSSDNSGPALRLGQTLSRSTIHHS